MKVLCHRGLQAFWVKFTSMPFVYIVEVTLVKGIPSFPFLLLVCTPFARECQVSITSKIMGIFNCVVPKKVLKISFHGYLRTRIELF